MPMPSIYADMLFYLVMILGLKFRLVSALMITFVIGYVADTLSFVPYGTMTISYLTALLVIHQVRSNIYLDSRIPLFLWVIVFSLVMQFTQIVFLKFSSLAFHFSLLILIARSIWESVLSLLLLPALDKSLFYDWAIVFRRKGILD